MHRSLASIVFTVALGFGAIGCGTTGVGDPCTPED